MEELIHYVISAIDTIFQKFFNMNVFKFPLFSIRKCSWKHDDVRRCSIVHSDINLWRQKGCFSEGLSLRVFNLHRRLLELNFNLFMFERYYQRVFDLHNYIAMDYILAY